MWIFQWMWAGTGLLEILIVLLQVKPQICTYLEEVSITWREVKAEGAVRECLGGNIMEGALAFSLWKLGAHCRSLFTNANSERNRKKEQSVHSCRVMISLGLQMSDRRPCMTQCCNGSMLALQKTQTWKTRRTALCAEEYLECREHCLGIDDESIKSLQKRTN